MPKCLGSFIASFFENAFIKSKYLAKIVIFLVNNKVI